MISWVKPVNPSHPYLENDPAPSFDPHHLRISPWLWFSCLMVPRYTTHLHGKHNSRNRGIRRSAGSLCPYLVGLDVASKSDGNTDVREPVRTSPTSPGPRAETRAQRRAIHDPPDGVQPLNPSRANEDTSRHCLRSKGHRRLQVQKGREVLQRPSNELGGCLPRKFSPSAVPDETDQRQGKTTHDGRLE